MHVRVWYKQLPRGEAGRLCREHGMYHSQLCKIVSGAAVPGYVSMNKIRLMSGGRVFQVVDFAPEGSKKRDNRRGIFRVQEQDAGDRQ